MAWTRWCAALETRSSCGDSLRRSAARQRRDGMSGAWRRAGDSWGKTEMSCNAWTPRPP
eukprot:CAMPEP_0185448270 /NCGR_PEP_ID=MMETSP1365-20130426/58369_1 /TAXON_ID=38817 /ORGANISM="Gephyrocapsa oceanica, Strain RCC1303" /LENGTH=58 /DNA_ID=CAMNT_0028054215 /DNA_START=58 /DNA_END=230 /DNA_ORIENTATION=+